VTTILRLTVREAVRRRLVWALFVMTLLVVAVTGWGFQRFVEVAHQRGLLDVEIRLGVSQLLILVAFMFSFVLAMTAVFFGAPAVAADVESGLMLGILSRPLRRADLLLGKWLGLAVLVVGYAVLSGAIEMAVTAALTGWVPPDPLAAVLYLAGEGVVLMTLALLLSTRLSVVTGGAVAVILFGLVWLVGILARFGAVLHIDPLTAAGTISQLVLPSDALWRGAAASLQAPTAFIAAAAGEQGAGGFDQVFTGSPPTPAELAWVVIWVAVLLAGAVRLFRNRDL
jgi:ABC-2 type transport system permease protein